MGCGPGLLGARDADGIFTAAGVPHQPGSWHLRLHALLSHRQRYPTDSRLAKRWGVRWRRQGGMIHVSEIAPVQPLPPKDTPIRDVGVFASAPASGTTRMASRWHVVAWWIVGGVFTLLLVGVGLMPLGHGDGFRTLRVTARLAASDTGAPIVGARVLPVSSYDLEHPWEPEEAWEMIRFLNPSWADGGIPGEDREEAGADDQWDYEGTRSGPGGRVGMTVELLTSETAHLFWSTSSAQEPREGVAALWIAPEGREPVIVRIEDADWRPHEEGEPHDIWGTYDLGTVVVPVGEPGLR